MAYLPLKLSEASGVPFYRQIVDQIAALIRSGELPVKTQLPSVRELAADLLVSLITVRRAYADLESEGLIIRMQGHGTYVRTDIASISRARSLKEGRQGLEQAVIHARQLGVSDNDIRTIIDEVLSRGGIER
jgi:DNA-binding transcriptional regulator YhcF (GntR family)